MQIELGHIEALARYPVKSMRGEPLERAALGWYGLDGDRRFAMRRVGERGGMPWLTASKLPALVCYTPLPAGDGGPTHVRTPDGDELGLWSDELVADVERRYGAPVEMMRLDRGIFDETPVSVITSCTAAAICRAAGQPDDVRRFRPNVVVHAAHPVPFEEDRWLGGVLTFGDDDDPPAVAVTTRDLRCAMVNFDPDDATTAASVMKAVVRANDNHAGVYGTVLRPGALAVGQRVRLRR